MSKPSLHNLISEFETAQAERELPEFGPGDTVIVNVKVVEGERTRVQAYEGVCIARSGACNTRIPRTRSSASRTPRGR